MIVRAKAKYIRISPRKVRLVIDVIRGLDLLEALNRLALMEKRAVTPIVKLIKSALANAEHNYNLAKENLYIKAITANDGPTLYRWMPKAHGRATPIRKRTSVIDLALEEKVPSKKVAKKSKKIETVKLEEKIENLPEERIDLKKREQLNRDDATAKGEINFDPKKQAGFRDVQQVPRQERKLKGFFKKMFRRKSGM